MFVHLIASLFLLLEFSKLSCGVGRPFSPHFHLKSGAVRLDHNLIAESESVGDSSLPQSQVGAFLTGVFAGAFAGATTDIILFPIDTIKTRLQSKAGISFSLSLLGNMYSGILPALAASAPSAATFFGAYDGLQRYLRPRLHEKHAPLVHILSACGGNLAQSVVRVPFEVIKQRLQVGSEIYIITLCDLLQ